MFGFDAAISLIQDRFLLWETIKVTLNLSPVQYPVATWSRHSTMMAMQL